MSSVLSVCLWILDQVQNDGGDVPALLDCGLSLQ